MRNFFAMDGPLYAFFNKVGGIIAVSFFWLVGCIPVVTIGTSTAAAYYAMVKVVRKQTGHVPSEYWRAFRRNLKYGIISTVIILVFVALVVFDSALFSQGVLPMDSTLVTLWGAASKILLFFVGVIALYLFPVMSRFELKFKDMLMMAFIMSVRFFYFTLLLIIGIGAILFLHLGGIIFGDILWLFRTFPLILVTPGLYFFLASFAIEKVMRKYMPPPDETVDPEEQKWYYK